MAMAASGGSAKARTVPKGWHIPTRAEILDGADSILVLMRTAREGLYVRIHSITAKFSGEKSLKQVFANIWDIWLWKPYPANLT